MISHQNKIVVFHKTKSITEVNKICLPNTGEQMYSLYNQYFSLDSRWKEKR